ncbi:hypothetical protein CKO28_00110 [Rhodovibrio sodomensis]|uniref:CopG family transcriptional regulator n=2 Tax=Rhodovibrio sodomensis TaxID=1088 RepID=A0ABS1D8Z8_9PROT|nr:hypothetical protein [Rhodovibrio sodomensis]
MLEAAEYGALTDLARAREQIAADPGAPTEVRVAIPGDQEVGLADIDRLAHELGVDRAGLASIALTLWLARNASEDADRYWDGVQARIEALPGDWSDSL